MQLEWVEVSGSTRIVAMAYGSESETIYVRFPDGVEWQYELCPQHVWDEFSAPSQSKGQYIDRVLNHKPHRRYAG
jgi:hypothetical protein